MNKGFILITACILGISYSANCNASPRDTLEEEYKDVLVSEFNFKKCDLSDPICLPLGGTSQLGDTIHKAIEIVTSPRSPRKDTSAIMEAVESYPDIMSEIQSRHLSEHSLQKNSIRILSIDGGGIRGILPLYFLWQLEKATGKRTYEMFDVIAGTSTGGMIALALSVASAKDVLDLYLKNGDAIFKKSYKIFGPKYTSANRKRIFREFFGNLKLSEAKVPTIVTAWELEKDTAYHLYSKWPNNNYFQHEHLDMLMSDAALATSAAPTYFEPERIHPLLVDGKHSEDIYTFLDGGVYAGNPSTIALNYGMTLFPHLGVDKIDLLSLGTGFKPIDYKGDRAKRWSVLSWLPALLHILLTGNGTSINADLTRLLNNNYDRVTTQLKYSDAQLDSVGKNILNLFHDAHDMIKDNKLILAKWARKVSRESQSIIIDID
jgi:hypothetical protein